MKLHYKGKYDLDPETLPQAPEREGAVQFREPVSIAKLGLIANIIALILMVLLAVPIVIFRKEDFYSFGFWIGMLLALAACFPHEILHALCFKEDVDLYTNLKQGMLFVVGTEPMSKARFVFMSLLPNLVFGLIPYIAGLLFPHCSILLGLGWCSIPMGAGDYLNVFNALTQMPKGAKTFMSGMHSFWYKETDGDRD